MNRTRGCGGGKPESADRMSTAVNLFQCKSQGGPPMVVNRVFHFKHVMMRMTGFRINAPGGGGIFINSFLDGPVLLIKISGRVLQQDAPCTRSVCQWRGRD